MSSLNPQSGGGNLHVDVDDLCRALHVDRDVFIAATKRTNRENKDSQQAAAAAASNGGSPGSNEFDKNNNNNQQGSFASASSPNSYGSTARPVPIPNSN